MESLNEMGAAEALSFEPQEKAKSNQIMYSKPAWWNDLDKGTSYETRCRQAIKDFVLGKEITKFKTYGDKRYGGTAHGHYVSTRKNGTELWMFKNNPSIKISVCIARKVNGGIVGNSSSLVFARLNKKTKAVGSGSRLKIQEVISEVLPMVPFGLFKETKLDIETLKIIDKGPSESLEIGRKRKGRDISTHFTGAMVFKIESKVFEDQYFLFDIDRNDLKLNNLNFFLSRLAAPARSIEEAYNLLKPKEVYEAERFLKRPCERQGEWFFIPVAGEFEISKQRGFGGGMAHAQAVLQSKGNRAHYVEKLSVEGYVKGKVTHGGHEHKPITLDGWHKAVPNTAVESFKISGAID